MNEAVEEGIAIGRQVTCDIKAGDSVITATNIVRADRLQYREMGRALSRGLPGPA